MASLCKNCAGTLVFDPKVNKLVCKRCGTSFGADEVKDYSEELLSDVNTLRKRAVSYYDANIYVCNHCGAEVILHGHEASTFCVYCGNPTIVFNRISKQISPDGIIPFRITKEQALENVQTMFGSGAFVPDEIKKLKVDKIRGIYIPYWIVDAEFHDSVVVKSSFNDEDGYRYNEYNGVTGRCTVHKVICDASKRFNNELSYNLEPFNLGMVKDFDPDYLAGFYSDISDLSLKELRKDVATRCDKMYCEKVMGQLPGAHKEVIGRSPSVEIHDDPIYALFPVWCMTYTFEGITHTILVNGQTGKVVGTVPFARKKAIGYIISRTLLISVPIIALLLFSLLKFNEFSLLWSSISTIVITAAIFFIGITVQIQIRNAGNARDKIAALQHNLKVSRSQSTADYIRNRTEV